MEGIFKSKIWRIPLFSILTGIIISAVTSASTYFMSRGTNEWTLAMGDTVFWIGTVLAAVLFLITGLLCFRDMGRMDIAKSAAIVVSYYIAIVALEQLMLSATGRYPLILLWLFIPVKLYSAIHQVFLKFTEISVWTGLSLIIAAPFLYTVFGKKES